jgi:hypothetical protein
MATTGIANAAHIITIITVRLMGVLLLPSSFLHTSVASARDRSSALVIAQLWSGHPRKRPNLNLSSTCRIGFHGTYAQERCHLAPTLAPSGVRGMEWADGEEGGWADVHRDER